MSARGMHPVPATFDVDTIHQLSVPRWYVSYREQTSIVKDDPVDASHFVYVEATRAVLLFVDGGSFEATAHAKRDLYPIDQLDIAFARGVDSMQVCLWFPHQSVRFVNYHGPHDRDVELSATPLYP